MTITSAQNSKFKFLKSLLRSRNRRKEGLFICEGRPELDRCLAAGYQFSEIVFCPDFIDEVQIYLEFTGVPRWAVNRALFEQIAYQHKPDNFLAIIKAKKHDQPLVQKTTEPPFYILLEELEKPGNLGAIIRSADGAGAHGIILTDPNFDIYNPNVIRNSRGAIFGTPLWVTDNETAHSFLKDGQVNTYAAALQDSSSVYQSDFNSGSALILGKESQGLNPFWRDQADAIVKIPMLGSSDSLNVSISAAIMAFEVRRQRSSL